MWQELHGMLWVFGDPSAEGWKASGAASAAGPTTPSSAFDEMLEGSLAVKSPWFQRDVPLSFETLMENLHDPSHVPQSHSGVIVSSSSARRLFCHVA
jgi:pheophorbide a oxygenase